MGEMIKLQWNTFCLPSNSYFPWTPDYTPFILGLNIPNFVFADIIIMVYQNDFGMLTSD